MWPRIAEVLIAGWLAAAPFVFGRAGHGAEGAVPWLSDVVCAGLIAACALVSLARPQSRLHLAELAISAWLVAYGFFASSVPHAALQNDILVGLVLPMFAIIPNQATLPPVAWREPAWTEVARTDGSQRPA